MNTISVLWRIASQISIHSPMMNESTSNKSYPLGVYVSFNEGNALNFVIPYYILYLILQRPPGYR